MRLRKSVTLLLAILLLFTFSQSALAGADPIQWTVNTDTGSGNCTAPFREHDETSTGAYVLQYATNTYVDCHIQVVGQSYVSGGITQVTFDWSYAITSTNHSAYIHVYADGLGSGDFELYREDVRDDYGSASIDIPSWYTGNVYFVVDAVAKTGYSTGFSFAEIKNISFN
ncbi:hypothetical protein [Paenibacillus sp. y28]|uniref:hypothetical protein n=1 Tax=Paenibacillus sp. y28 TaxID=3129110 RepID=UPI0030192217